MQQNLWPLVDSNLPGALIADCTALANETDVKVIDPNRLEVIEAVGCKVREVCI